MLFLWSQYMADYIKIFSLTYETKQHPPFDTNESFCLDSQTQGEIHFIQT
jgi:hypothetical protein